MQTRANVTFSLDTGLLNKLNAHYSPLQQSRVIERLLESLLPTTDEELAAAALEVETHPDFAFVREVTAFVDAASMDMARSQF